MPSEFKMVYIAADEEVKTDADMEICDILWADRDGKKGVYLVLRDAVVVPPTP